MIIFTTIYIIVTLILVGQIGYNYAVSSALVLLLVSVLGFWAGAGTRGMLFGSNAQKIVGLGIGAAFVGISYFASEYAEVVVKIFSYKFSTFEWSLVGAVVGFITARREDSGL